MKSIAIAVILITCVAFASVTVAHTWAKDGATIRNSGSTNIPGYVIAVHSDGTANVYASTRGGQPQGPAQSSRVAMNLVLPFLRNLQAAKAAGRIAAQSCMKSASFGSATVVQYHGWTSPDLECPGDGFVVSLGSQAHAIASALGLPRRDARRTLLPNEPRRVPEAPVQASPMPE